MANTEVVTLRAFAQWLTARGARTRIRYAGDRYHVLIARRGGGRAAGASLMAGRDLVVTCLAAQAAYDLGPVCAAN